MLALQVLTVWACCSLVLLLSDRSTTQESWSKNILSHPTGTFSHRPWPMQATHMWSTLWQRPSCLHALCGDRSQSLLPLSVRHFSSSFIFLNAASCFCAFFRFEMNFAVNVLGTFVLTESLLPALRKAGPEAKVITVATGGVLTQPLSSDLQMEKKFDGTQAYARNKRVQLAVTEKWEELYGKDIGFYSMHPGWVDTTTLKNSMPGFYNTSVSLLKPLLLVVCSLCST